MSTTFPQAVVESIQQECADILASDPYFSNIPIITEKIYDFENEITVNVAAIGICVVILTPTMSQSLQNVGAYFDEVAIDISTIENVIVNQSATGTGKRALATAEYVHTLMHMTGTGRRLATTSKQVVALRPTVQLTPPPPKWNRHVIYRNRYTTDCGLQYIMPTIAQVKASQSGAGQPLVLQCATPGSAIYYTLDGKTRPAPRTGSLYLGPVTVPPSSKVQALAWLAGWLTTNNQAATYTAL